MVHFIPVLNVKNGLISFFSLDLQAKTGDSKTCNYTAATFNFPINSKIISVSEQKQLFKSNLSAQNCGLKIKRAPGCKNATLKNAELQNTDCRMATLQSATLQIMTRLQNDSLQMARMSLLPFCCPWWLGCQIIQNSGYTWYSRHTLYYSIQSLQGETKRRNWKGQTKSLRTCQIFNK